MIKLNFVALELEFLDSRTRTCKRNKKGVLSQAYRAKCIRNCGSAVLTLIYVENVRVRGLGSGLGLGLEDN